MDYWFDVFHYKNKDYLAIYSTSFEIYEIKETPLELKAELINEFLIVPGCRVTVKAENNIVAIRYLCRYQIDIFYFYLVRMMLLDHETQTILFMRFHSKFVQIKNQKIVIT